MEGIGMAEIDLAPRATTSSRWERQTEHGDRIFWLLTLFFALVIVGLVVAVGIVTFNGSAEARAQYGWGFLFGTDWNPAATDVSPATFGAWPAIRGTLLSSLFALILAGPIGVAIGIFLAELAPLRLRDPLGFMVELLAAIPSVIYGLWGVAVFVPFFTDWIATPVSETIGLALPWLAGPVTVGRGLLVCSVVIALMILPTIASITRDVLRAVPPQQREVLLALGATRWEVIWLSVLPYARAGIIGGVMLGLGRALGETMAATMLIGNSTQISDSLFAPATTAAALVASELTNANDLTHESALITVALALFGITLILNLCARLLVWQTSRGPAGGRG
jgi:phosphate transport system permease protein